MGEPSSSSSLAPSSPGISPASPNASSSSPAYSSASEPLSWSSSSSGRPYSFSEVAAGSGRPRNARNSRYPPPGNPYQYVLDFIPAKFKARVEGLKQLGTILGNLSRCRAVTKAPPSVVLIPRFEGSARRNPLDRIQEILGDQISLLLDLSRTEWIGGKFLGLYVLDPDNGSELLSRLASSFPSISSRWGCSSLSMQHAVFGQSVRARFTNIPNGMSDADIKIFLFCELALPINTLSAPIQRTKATEALDNVFVEWSAVPNSLYSLMLKGNYSISASGAPDPIRWDYHKLPGPFQPTCSNCSGPHSSPACALLGPEKSFTSKPPSPPERDLATIRVIRLPSAAFGLKPIETRVLRRGEGRTASFQSPRAQAPPPHRSSGATREAPASSDGGQDQRAPSIQVPPSHRPGAGELPRRRSSLQAHASDTTRVPPASSGGGPARRASPMATPIVPVPPPAIPVEQAVELSEATPQQAPLPAGEVISSTPTSLVAYHKVPPSSHESISHDSPATPGESSDDPSHRPPISTPTLAASESSPPSGDHQDLLDEASSSRDEVDSEVTIQELVSHDSASHELAPGGQERDPQSGAERGPSDRPARKRTYSSGSSSMITRSVTHRY